MSKADDSGLLPCPFCGSPTPQLRENDDGIYIECYRKGCDVSVRMEAETAAQAKSQWNTRADSQPARKGDEANAVPEGWSVVSDESIRDLRLQIVTLRKQNEELTHAQPADVEYHKVATELANWHSKKQALISVLISYARSNPKWQYGDKEQDPCGAHGLLEWIQNETWYGFEYSADSQPVDPFEQLFGRYDNDPRWEDFPRWLKEYRASITDIHADSQPVLAGQVLSKSVVKRIAAQTAGDEEAIAQEIVGIVLGFNNLDNLGALRPEHPNRRHVTSVVAAALRSRQASQPARVVSEKLHGETTRLALNDLRERVVDGYESIYRTSNWSGAMQVMLGDIHYLLTFFSSQPAADKGER